MCAHINLPILHRPTSIMHLMVIVVKKVEEPPPLEPEETDESSHRLKRAQLEAVGMYCFLLFYPSAMPVGKGIHIYILIQTWGALL